MPDEMSDFRRHANPQQKNENISALEGSMDIEEETKVCSDPLCMMGGVPQPLDGNHFGRSHRSPDGYRHTCKECQGRRIKEGWAKRRKAQVLMPESKSKSAETAGAKPNGAESAPEILLNFKGREGLFDQLKNLADREERQVVRQIFYLIRKAVFI